ncbi:hypothetical protein L9F63_018467, partial [Diploptera punctata]
KQILLHLSVKKVSCNENVLCTSHDVTENVKTNISLASRDAPQAKYSRKSSFSYFLVNFITTMIQISYGETSYDLRSVLPLFLLQST